MIDRDRLANYLDGIPDPELDAQLASDRAALEEVVAQRRADQLLKSLLVSDFSRQALKRSVLGAIAGGSLDKMKARILRDTARRRVWWPVWVTAAIVAMAALVSFWRPARGPVTLASIVGDVRVSGNPVARPTGLQVGDVVQLTGTASASVQLVDGTELALSRGAELRVLSADGKQLVLQAGRLTAAVRKQEQPLELQTPLAGLRVLGTKFDVEAGAQQTRLEVREGLVRVDHAQRNSAVEVGGGQFAVAVPGTELVAGVLPAAQVPGSGRPGGSSLPGRLFSEDSPWNQPIGKARYADIDAPAWDLARHGAVVAPASHFRPIWTAQAEDRAGLIVSRYSPEEFANGVPVPAVGIRGEWVNGTVIDATKGVAYELVGARRTGDAIEAVWCAAVDLRGRGVPPEATGHLHSGLPAVAGVIRAGELKDGIRHALAVAVLHEGLNRQVVVAPAQRVPLELAKVEAMGTTGNVGFGSRLAIPREVNVAALGLSAAGLELARALQEYGAFVTHSYPSVPGGGQGDWRQPHVQFFVDAPMDALDWQGLAAEASVLATKLKVVTP